MNFPDFSDFCDFEEFPINQRFKNSEKWKENVNIGRIINLKDMVTVLVQEKWREFSFLCQLL